MTAGYSYASPVPYTNNQHDNVFVFDGADYSINTDTVFPESFEAFPKRISEAARVFLGRYSVPHIAYDGALVSSVQFLEFLNSRVFPLNPPDQVLSPPLP